MPQVKCFLSSMGRSGFAYTVEGWETMGTWLQLPEPKAQSAALVAAMYSAAEAAFETCDCEQCCRVFEAVRDFCNAFGYEC